MLEIMFNLIAAVITGFIIGLEREITNKHAGLRTHILVCLGSCVFTILSVKGFPTFAAGDNVDIHSATGVRDTARIAAQIVTGIGFIGAGTVLRHGSSVHGLTTAATLWMAASIGMACGVGRYDIAFSASIICILVLVGVKFFEKKILVHKKLFIKNLQVCIVCANDATKDIHEYIAKNFVFIKELENVMNHEKGNSKILAVISIRDNNPIQALYKKFEYVNGIKSITISETDEQ